MAAAFLILAFVSGITALPQNESSNRFIRSATDNECGRLPPGYTGTSLPWHALIYKEDSSNYRYRCGGTLVKPTVVLSVAHCVTSSKGEAEPPSKYAVIVGQNQRSWDSHDTGAQKSDVSKITVPAHYRGYVVNYQSDISVLTLAKAVAYNAYIQPACLSFEVTDDMLSQKGLVGKMASFDGFTSNSLTIFNMPLLTVEECFAEVLPSFREYITADKFCTEFKNSSGCPAGNSGAGLSFIKEELGVQRYYLKGILSTAPKVETPCGVNGPLLYTHVLSHETFIKTNV